ncbi:MAG: hypothetical protein ABFS30_10745 [Pseudomonadota bacterium]
MSNQVPIHLKAVLARSAVALALVIGPGASFGATAENNYFSLKKIFPNSKCSPVIPNYELMIAGFAGGEFTKYKIHDDQGEVVEVISTFINKDRSQWAIVGSKTESKVIFCLYASGIGKGSVVSQAIKPK